MTRTQKRKSRKDSKTYTYDGKTQTLKEWAEELGVTVSALRKRMASGVPPDKLFSTDRRVTTGEKRDLRKYIRKLEKEMEDAEYRNSVR